MDQGNGMTRCDVDKGRKGWVERGGGFVLGQLDRTDGARPDHLAFLLSSEVDRGGMSAGWLDFWWRLLM